MEALSGAPSRHGLARRALATALLWAGFWLLTLGLCVGLAWIPFAQARFKGEVGLGGYAAGLMALTLAWAARPRGWFKKKAPHPPVLPREAHRALYDFVEQIARRMNQPPPDGLILLGDANAFATVERRWLGLQRERLVGVGLPLVAFLERDELAAVVCHELGHHLGGDLALGPWVYRTRRALGDAVSDLDDSSFFLDLPFRAYGQLFLRVSASVSRDQEWAADACSVEAFGARAASGALEKVDRLQPLWSAYLEHEALRYLSDGIRVPLLEGFRRFLGAPRLRAEIQTSLERRSATAPSPWDSHPSLAQRLAAFGRKPAGASLAGRGCLELLGGEAAAEDALYQQWSDTPLRALAWEALGTEVLLPSYQKVFERTGLDPRAPLETLVPLLAQAEALVDKARGASLNLLSPEAKRRRARGLLSRWLTAALASRGFTLTLTPGAEVRMVRGEVEIEPSERVERLAAGQLTEAEYLAWARSIEADAARDVG